VLLLVDELDSEADDLDVTVRTGTDGVDLVVAAGALPFWVLFGAVVGVAPVEAGVAAGVEVVVGAEVAGAGVVEGAVAVDTPGGGAKTAAPAPTGAASASSASPHRDTLSVVAWMLERARMGVRPGSEDTACVVAWEAAWGSLECDRRMVRECLGDWAATVGAVRRRHRKPRTPNRARASAGHRMACMPPKQRQIRIEQRGAMADIQALEQRSDEELESEVKYKSAAMAILGSRAAERFDAEKARAYFQRAIAAARPQERMQIRRMADASLALAERRPDALKDAVQRLGQAPPSGRQMLALRAMGLLVPPASAGILARVRGILLIVVLVVVLLALGLGVVELISLPFGGLGIAPGVLLGLFLVLAVLAVAAMIGRRRRDRAAAARAG
jgi:hypothetical protein